MSISIKKFDMTSVDFNRKCIFIGKTGTGKSILVKDLLYNFRWGGDPKKQIPIGQVISTTESASPYYKKFIPPIVIHSEYDQEKTRKIVKRQKKIVKEYGEENPNAATFLLLDDCLHNVKKITGDKSIQDIFYNGRHYALLFILTMQYPLGIPPSLRTNIDYTFILREPIHKNRKILYENYAGMFKSFDNFCTALDQLTDDYGCMVINNRTKSNKLEDQVFYYKAKVHENNFKMCSPQLWDYSNKNYKSDDDNSSEDEQPKGKKKIIIKKI